jgi:biotin transporter BioY
MEAVAQSIGICLAALTLGAALGWLTVWGVCVVCDREWTGIE